MFIRRPGLGQIAIDGEIQTVDGAGITGWAADTGRNGAAAWNDGMPVTTYNIQGPPLSVDIFVDGVFLASQVANTFNAIAARDLGYSLIGFNVPIPNRFADGLPHTVTGNITNTTTPLRGGGKSFTIAAAAQADPYPSITPPATSASLSTIPMYAWIAAAIGAYLLVRNN